MSQPVRRTVRASTSFIRATFRSVISWMLWLLTTPQRLIRGRQLRQEAREEATRHQQEALLRAALLEALTPLATALRRQDQLLVDRTRALQEDLQTLASHQESLLVEVLSSLQPTASQQLMPLLGSTSLPLHPRSPN